MPLVIGFGLALLASLGLAIASLMAQHEIEQMSDARHAAAENLLQVEHLRTDFALIIAAHRGYLLTGEPELKENASQHRAELNATLDSLRAAASPQQQQLFDSVVSLEQEHERAVARVAQRRHAGDSQRAIAEAFAAEVVPWREATQQAIKTIATDYERTLQLAESSAARAQARASGGLLALTAIAVLAIACAAFFVLRNLRRDALIANAWTTFLSIASHDLKTPLSTLSLRVQLIERVLASGGADEDRLKSELGRLKNGIDSMNELVHNVLDISRLRSNTLPLNPQPLDLAEIVNAVVERAREGFRRAGVELTVSANAVQGLWDPLRMEQVTSNLLSNALKYGDGKPVELSLQGDGEWVRLAVKDHGKGIPANEQDFIFKPFTRLAHQPVPGHGLGLFIVSSIVEAHGGRIHLESRPSVGTTFTIELPRVPHLGGRAGMTSSLRAPVRWRRAGAATSKC